MLVIITVAFYSIYLLNKSVVRKNNGVLSSVKLRHSIFFILCFVIVFFQCDLDYIIGIADTDDNYLWIDKSVVCKSLAISNLALISLILGYYIKDTASKVCTTTSIRSFNFGGKRILCFITGFLLIIYVIFVPHDYLYNGYERGVDAGPIWMIMGYLQGGFIAIFTLYSLDYTKQSKMRWIPFFKVPLILAIIYSILVLFTGKRTETIRILTLVLISYQFCNVGKISYKKIIIVGLVFVGIFSIAGVLRSMNGNVIDGVQMISNYSSISPFTREYANSVNTMHIAVANYPSKLEYNYGATFLPPFLKIIPGLSSVYTFLWGEIPSSADTFTDIYFGGDRIWGVGSSCVADIYISFGVIGVVVLFILFGFFLRYLEKITFEKVCSPYLLALSFSAFSAFLFACRSSLSAMFLCFAYSCILIWLVSFIKRCN